MLARCHQPPVKGLSIKVVKQIDDISDAWMSLYPALPLMHVRYYRALEQALPEHMEVRYGLVYLENRPVMAIPVQILPFNARKSLANALANPADGTVWDRLRTFVAGKIHFYTLIVGNVLLTGEYAYTSNLESTSHGKILDWGIEQIAEHLDAEGMVTSVVLVKDFTPEHAQLLSCMEDRYFKFRVQPNMTMQTPSQWQHFDDYLSALSSKYRIRTKNVLKRGVKIHRKALDLDEILSLESELYRLYREVASQADFNLFLLHPHYFLSLKKQFGEDFQVVTYVDNDRLIGFFTYFSFAGRLEAHFLGFTPELNKELAIYHNMLLDLLKTCTEKGCTQLVYGRTALEIKSSLGAVPEDLFCLLRHRKRIHQHFVPYLFEYLRTDLDWEPRHPFRDEEMVTASQQMVLK